ncbi:tetratricopeptide repeat protein [bacterium]|nr:tetratricopeptide repeat protein [bacterium]
MPYYLPYLPTAHMTIFGALVLAFCVWMIIDCIRNDNPVWWIYIILLMNFTGLGALIYFLVNKLPQYEIGRRWDRLFMGGRRISELKAQIRHMDRPYHWAKLGDEYRAQRRWKEAADAYREALKRDPQTEEAQYGLGLTLLAMNDYDGALKYLQPLVDGDARYDYGAGAAAIARAWRGLGRNDNALAAFEKVLANFSYSDARYEYAELLHLTGRKQQAREQFETIIDDAAAAHGFNRARERRWGRKAKLFLSTHSMG